MWNDLDSTIQIIVIFYHFCECVCVRVFKDHWLNCYCCDVRRGSLSVYLLASLALFLHIRISWLNAISVQISTTNNAHLFNLMYDIIIIIIIISSLIFHSFCSVFSLFVHMCKCLLMRSCSIWISSGFVCLFHIFLLLLLLVWPFVHSFIWVFLFSSIFGFNCSFFFLASLMLPLPIWHNIFKFAKVR